MSDKVKSIRFYTEPRSILSDDIYSELGVYANSNLGYLVSDAETRTYRIEAIGLGLVNNLPVLIDGIRKICNGMQIQYTYTTT